MTAEAGEFLSALAIGEKGRVLGFELPPEYRQRLLEMGLTVGAEFEVVRFAPLGDPIDIKIRGYHLSLRKQEAGGIRVEKL
jgi:Fe2+ transport system protein FeoA